ncbi:MAG: hypothetical protein Q7S87_12845 [Agitococcus sp.]|nr:hypothetical protein [Agitococcus sp.]
MSKNLDDLSPEAIERMHNDIVIMRASKEAQKKTWQYWPLVAIMLGVIGAGYFGLLSVQQDVERDLALAARKTQREAMSQEQKQHEAYYQGMNEQTFNNQEQEAENARIAWENYNEEQRRLKVNEILAMAQQVSKGAYIDTRAANQYNQTAKIKSYWKCTDDTGVATYSTEPCNSDSKQPQQNTSRAMLATKPNEKEIRIVESQSVNVIHNPRPAPRVINNTVVVYRNADNQPNLNRMNSLDCQNAKRAYKFEKGSYFGKSFNRERILNDVVTKCGGWPSDLEG